MTNKCTETKNYVQRYEWENYPKIASTIHMFLMVVLHVFTKQKFAVNKVKSWSYIPLLLTLIVLSRLSD